MNKAEENLTLTVEDVEKINKIIGEVRESGMFDDMTQEFYEEVLSRFNQANNMEAPKEIYVAKGIFTHVCCTESKLYNIKYIRADLTEFTADDMRFAFYAVNEAIDNCEGKTKQELFEDALHRFKRFKEMTRK